MLLWHYWALVFCSLQRICIGPEMLLGMRTTAVALHLMVVLQTWLQGCVCKSLGEAEYKIRFNFDAMTNVGPRRFMPLNKVDSGLSPDTLVDGMIYDVDQFMGCHGQRSSLFKES
mmetsp:Transcript_873/g.1817  ORF Transcript_873/g.1817 Transcript_873/m.1817 type:complete len:115 (-) Transcript_873:24-368(-)